MPRVDLSAIAGDHVRVLIGHDRGLAARRELELDRLDGATETVVVTVPASVRTLTPSFVQGLFAGSVHRLGEREFFERYRFDAPQHIVGDVQAGVDRVLTSRHLVDAD